ncbi:MAG: tetratricopeptide repeat protein, partial [Proteobacteria bacterium]|nr:tetratricopeptide repeat protein [Pseudomonadota bacterium]
VLKSALSNTIDWFEPTSAAWSYDPRRRMLTVDCAGTGKADWSRDVSGGRTLWYEFEESGFPKIAPFKRPANQDQSAPYAVAFPAYETTVVTLRLPPDVQFGRRGDNIAATFGGLRYVRRAATVGDTVMMYRSSRALAPEFSAAQAAADEPRRAAFRSEPMFVWARPKPPPAAAKPAPAASDAKALVSQGFAEAAAGRKEAALALADGALAARAGDPDALALRGMILFQLSRWGEAADALALAIPAAPKPDAVMMRSRVYALLNDRRLDEAAKAADAYVAAFPQSLNAHEVRTLVLERRHDDSRALEEAEATIRAMPDQPAALRLKSNVLWNAGRREDAIAVVSEQIRRDPDDAAAVSNRGAMETALKRYEAAGDDLADASRMNPLDQATILRQAELAERQGRNSQAMAILDAAVARWPTSVRLLNGRCWNRAMSGEKLDLAAQDCDAAMARAPADLPTMDSRAFVSFRQKRYADAVRRYDAVLKIDPTFASALYARGMARQAAGDRAGGAADMAQAVKLAPAVAETYEGVGPGR